MPEQKKPPDEDLAKVFVCFRLYENVGRVSSCITMADSQKQAIERYADQALHVGKTPKNEVLRILRAGDARRGPEAAASSSATQWSATSLVQDGFSKVSHKLVIPATDGGEPMEWVIADPMLLIQHLTAHEKVMQRLFTEALQKFPSMPWRARLPDSKPVAALNIRRRVRALFA